MPAWFSAIVNYNNFLIIFNMDTIADEQPLPAWPSAYYDKWQSYEVETGVRACSHVKERNGELMRKPDNPHGIDTLWAMFKYGLSISKDRNCLGWRDGDTYKWWNYQEVYDRVQKLAGALSSKFKRQEVIGIYSKSTPNWMVTALAFASRSLVFVPLYDTLGADSCNYIINQTEMSFVFVDSTAPAKRIIGNAAKTPSLRNIVMFSEPDEEVVKMAQESRITLVTLEQFIKNSTEVSYENAFDLPKPDDLCTIFYTSGTTGDPKGVMHTHESMVAAYTMGMQDVFLHGAVPGFAFRRDDVCLHFLPLAHVYGFGLAIWLLYCGSALGFYGGNVAKLLEDASILKPTLLPMVPRLMNRIYAKIVGELQNSRVKSAVFWFAYGRKRELLRQGYITRESMWDKLVFRKIQALIGDRVRFMCVGSAPVAADVLEFFRVVFGTLILEGYGQTETCASGLIAMGPVGGNVGHVVACLNVKLVDVPECGYYMKDGKGEICFKGFSVMKGYFKAPEKTAETIDADGWLHTGDIGEFLPDFSIRIVDRKKHIFKLAQGEYIAPEKIEGVYLLCPEIAQIFVDGNSLEPYVVAVAYPEPTMSEKYALRYGLDPKTVHQDDGFRKYILETLRNVGKANKLNSLEQIKSIYFTNEAFSVENDLLTPTMKNKRPELRKYFKAQIEALYKAGPLVGGESS